MFNLDFMMIILCIILGICTLLNLFIYTEPLSPTTFLHIQTILAFILLYYIMDTQFELIIGKVMSVIGILYMLYFIITDYLEARKN